MRPRLPALPLDLVIEVLVCLPVETLMKFRCVSKSWRALIDSAKFKQLHLRRIRSCTSAEEQNKFLFQWRGPSSLTEIGIRKKEDRYYVTDFDSPDKMLKKTSTLELSCPFENQNDRLSLDFTYGTCNGLVCFGYSDPSNDCADRIVILWNPYIKKYWELPSHPLPVYENYSICVHPHSFGYDDIADDYKVVRWLSIQEQEGISPPIYQEAIVYSLKSNGWTSLPQVPYSHPTCIPTYESGILVNCALHWILIDSLLAAVVAILALDLRTDKFHCIPLPLEMEREGKGKAFYILKALDSCLCLIPQQLGEPFLDVWIMKDYGVKDSWVKLIIRFSTFIACRGIPSPHPVAYSQRGTQLIWNCGNCVMWYDIEREDWVWATLVNSRSSIMGHVFPFVASLIEPSPYGAAIAISDQNAGIKRVETNLFMQGRSRKRSRSRAPKRSYAMKKKDEIERVAKVNR